MLATAWGLGIANPQSIKRLGHFLTADCKSAETPNISSVPDCLPLGISGATGFGGGCIGLSSARRSTPLGVPTDMLSVVKKVRPIKRGDLQSPLSHRYAGCCLGAGDCKSPEHKEVRSFFDGGLQIRRDA